jgi:hypothetical protein
MNRDSLDALIAHESAALREAFPQISGCRARIETLSEGEARRYSVLLDIRLPEHQSLISGKSKHDTHAAVHAAFEEARRQLEELARRAA